MYANKRVTEPAHKAATGRDAPQPRPGRGRRRAAEVRSAILKAAAAVGTALTFPESDDARADLREQLHAFARVMTGTRTGRVLVELIGRCQTDPDLRAALNEHYTTPRRELAIDTMRRGQRLEPLRRDVDLPAVVDQLWGACYNRLLNSHLPVTAEFADTLLDNVWRGIAP